MRCKFTFIMIFILIFTLSFILTVDRDTADFLSCMSILVHYMLKTKARRHKQSMGIDSDNGKTCPSPLQHSYDTDILDTLAKMYHINGSIPKHDKYVAPVNFFAPSGSSKYWVKQPTPFLGRYCTHSFNRVYYIHYLHHGHQRGSLNDAKTVRW
jgi:hypothetical protein